jgi:tryptophan 2,3-dioxygenase
MSGIYYGDYLQLDKILGAQELESAKVGKSAHDEMLFIITHQSYELWFKQIIFELESIVDIFQAPTVEERRMGRVIHRLARVKSIQRVLVDQIDIIETMTPMDFLEFRDLLVPASGFQSVQFKKIEILLGLRREDRIKADREFFQSRLCPMDLGELDDLDRDDAIGFDRPVAYSHAIS